jgi:hypothetical protein
MFITIHISFSIAPELSFLSFFISLDSGLGRVSFGSPGGLGEEDFAESLLWLKNFFYDESFFPASSAFQLSPCRLMQ